MKCDTLEQLDIILNLRYEEKTGKETDIYTQWEDPSFFFLYRKKFDDDHFQTYHEFDLSDISTLNQM